ncbi:SMI1/KNR4 family protein [Kitasatospora sp. NPDC088779]|uniref:SMI1/KNR4 family protein n=1 Tax=Kitasatospora sp. NPDC088779 TaxID=3154964 RepID=UPI0034323094
MDPRLPRLRRKLAQIPFSPLRSHSFGEEKHRFQLGRTVSPATLDAFETDGGVVLPAPYRDFLTFLGATGASPFYGLLPLSRCELFTMDPKGAEDGAPRGFTTVEDRARPGDRFLHIIEAGCSDVVLLGVTGPLTGRIVTGNSDGFWGPDLSSAPDFIAWYELWLDEMAAGHDSRALELTSPASRSAERRARPTS